MAKGYSIYSDCSDCHNCWVDFSSGMTYPGYKEKLINDYNYILMPVLTYHKGDKLSTWTGKYIKIPDKAIAIMEVIDSETREDLNNA